MEPIVTPAPYKKLKTKQSKYEQPPVLPLRGIVLAPSGGGGSTLLQWFILNGHRVFVFFEAWKAYKDHTFAAFLPYELPVTK